MTWKTILLVIAATVVFFGKKSISTAQTFQDNFPPIESFEESTWIMLLHYAYGPSASSVFEGYNDPLELLWDTSSEQGTDVVLLKAPKSKRIYLSFRGTDGEESDLQTNFNLKLVPFGDSSSLSVAFSEGNVHEGFNQNLFGGISKLYLTLDNEIRSTMAQYIDYQLSITGHSLGGALAILYGAHVAKSVLPGMDILVQTIGSPRIGDETFKSSIRQIRNLANWRLVYKDDVIPRLPLETQGYLHAGHMIYLRDEETEAYFEQTGDLDRYAGIGFNDFLVPPALDASLLMPIFHHVPWSYLNGLAKVKAEGWWPADFVPFSEQEKICCGSILVVCYRYDYPPC